MLIFEGDKLISINGIDLTCLPHGEAVNILRRVEEKATILVQHEAELTALEVSVALIKYYELLQQIYAALEEAEAKMVFLNDTILFNHRDDQN